MTSQTRTSAILGAILIAAGILLFFGQVTGFLNWGGAWPLIVIGVGAAFFAGMFLGGKAAAPLAIPGSIISSVGLILFVQNIFGWWDTWSYAWGLIIVAVGTGIAIAGMYAGQPEQARNGWGVARVGLILFLIFGAFFEFILRGGLSFWPLLLILAGLLMLLARIIRLARGGQDHIDLFGPIVLLGIGGLALLSNLGVMPGYRLLTLLSLWPLLLVAAGVQMIFGRRSPWIGAALGLLLVAVLFTAGLAGERLGLTTLPYWMVSADWGEGGLVIRERISGSGDLVSRAYSVSDFDKISLELPGRLEISQTGSESLEIEAEENLHAYIVAEVRGSELVIRAKPGVGLSPRKGLTYRITVADLQEVRFSSLGEVVIGPLSTSDLSLYSSGAGDFSLADLQAESLRMNISGAGSSTVAGAVNELNIQISGAGRFTGSNLESQTARVQISGMGDASLWVRDDLSVQISGAGNVGYFGDPTINESISGVGNMRRLGDK